MRPLGHAKRHLTHHTPHLHMTQSYEAGQDEALTTTRAHGQRKRNNGQRHAFLLSLLPIMRSSSSTLGPARRLYGLGSVVLHAVECAVGGDGSFYPCVARGR